MSRSFPITSPSNPRIKRLLRLRKHRDRRDAGVFLAEGRREVERAAAAGLVIEELYECPELLGREPLRAYAAHRFAVTEAILTKAAYRDDPEGVLAVVRTPVWTLNDLSGGGLVLVAVGTEKPGNLGAMVRTAGAAGCLAVLATGPVDAFNPNAIRASTGAVFHVPVVEAEAGAIIDWCATRRFRLVATTPDGGEPYTALSYAGNMAIVIGPEDRGLDRAWLDAADARATIPMRTDAADSLNAAAAAAILLFEAARQRGGAA